MKHDISKINPATSCKQDLNHTEDFQKVMNTDLTTKMYIVFGWKGKDEKNINHDNDTWKEINKRLDTIGAQYVYNEMDLEGWYIDAKYETELFQIAEELKIKPHEIPSNYKNFEEFRFEKIKDNVKILKLKCEEISRSLSNTLDIDNPLTEEMRELFLQTPNGKSLIKFLNKYQKEKTKLRLSNIKNISINIQFIKDKQPHFLFNDAPEMPRLVNINEKGIHKPFIRKGIVAELVGAGGIGKTHFLTQLAICIASGVEFLEKYPIEEAGYVHLVLGENSEEDIHRLLRKTYKALESKLQDERLKNTDKYLSVMSVTGKDASFINKEGLPTEFFNIFLDALKKQEPEKGWSCIILDPISRFLGADAENDNAAATRFISLLEKMTLELKGKPTILFGHHMNKSGVMNKNTDQTAGRGSSALTDGARLQINLDKVDNEPNQINMKVVKTNHTSIGTPKILIKDESGCLSFLKEAEIKKKKPARPGNKNKSAENDNDTNLDSLTQSLIGQ